MNELAKKTSEVSELPCVIFRLAKNKYALPISQVKEITQVESLHPLPNAPENVIGMLDLRGHFLPVVDLVRKLGDAKSARAVDEETLDSKPQTDLDLLHILIVGYSSEGENISVGLLVDEVYEVIYVPLGTVEPAPPMTLKNKHASMVGIFKKEQTVVMLLDCRRMFSTDEVNELPALGAD